MPKRICFYDAKPYDRACFDAIKDSFNTEIVYFETKLNPDTAVLSGGFDGVCAFVNDDIGSHTIDILCSCGIGILALRCAGFNNVDIAAAAGRLKVVRVPDYSPHAVAEHAAAMLLTLIRRTHKAYIRTREYNFSLTSLEGFELFGKTVGIIGTGKIGKTFAEICRGFGMKVIAFDPYPSDGFDYTDLDTLCRESDIISLHCPLSNDTFHMINRETLSIMKPQCILINTSRGALIDTAALLYALESNHLGGAALDVFEEESEFFFEDFSNRTNRDDLLTQLISLPNVLVTSHQAFLTREALSAIARVTLQNFDAFFHNLPLYNEISPQNVTFKKTM